MKKLLLLVVVFTFVGVASAQEKSKSNQISTEKAEKRNNFDEMSKELNLTEAQQAQIQQINEDYKAKKQAIRSNGTAADFKKLNDEKQAAVDAVLTPEQRAKKQQYKEQKMVEKQQKAEMKSQKQ